MYDLVGNEIYRSASVYIELLFLQIEFCEINFHYRRFIAALLVTVIVHFCAAASSI